MVAFENHPVHLKYINRLIASDDFKVLQPQIQQAAFQHAYVHLYAIKMPDAVFQQVVVPVATQLGMVPPPPMVPQGNTAPAAGAAAKVPGGA
jgi:hypothetical protein